MESNIECFWSNLKSHPQCPHGPTLLFARRINEDLNYFYACSACRDRKICHFYLKKDEELTKAQKERWQGEIKKYNHKHNHQKSYIRFNELLSEQPSRRAYCHTCEKLMSVDEVPKHSEHEVTKDVSNDQMYNPTTLLKPLTDSRKEAQYLFSKKTTTDITNLLINLGAKHVLCIGAPRIHEHIIQNYDDKMSSLLLDFDGRFHDFFGPLSFCWYNLFNHHFFNKESQQIFKDFLTQDNGKDIYVVCDPPFGGRVEPMSQTMKMISDLHKKWNGLSEKDELKIIFILPYFMEPIMHFKSNPAGVDGGLKDLKMSDYRVDYDNHSLFRSGSTGRKFGSPVRIFTNIPLNLLKLPEDDGYKYCKRCDKWVSVENKHCKLCKTCTSKDGRRYKHCKICNRCVKPAWEHCKKCERCAKVTHTCGAKPKVSGHCSKCNKTDHISNDCPEIVDAGSKILIKSQRKRKNDSGNNFNHKKQKLNDSGVIGRVVKNKKKHEKEEEVMKKAGGKKEKKNKKIAAEKENSEVETMKVKKIKVGKENEEVVKEKDDENINKSVKESKDDSKSVLKKKIKMKVQELKGDSKITLKKKVINANCKLGLKKKSIK
ncbi:rRNA N6-adenosine-methyltransferase ZCCHC4 [Microplitis demolitor]|uniref:rRNA N6-adenosine-methyltransferase ZCCHC4 n=1 Tax=Microplitis demolitor TaxID=69319 RepID=UPI0004CCFDAC|nr:rRNA N6-adenosine-methyltransferase ZCCHC4 [Microplitis demolitor]